MKKLFAVLLFLCIISVKQNVAQTNPTLLTTLPSVLIESSGVEVNGPKDIWTHNDSGDKACIYNIDTLGNLLRTLHMSFDTAIDCEDITQDQYGNYYIGDFGNNNNDRTNLMIYKIPNPDSIVGDTVVPQIIYFHYPDQTMFPPDLTLRNFDCEAMFHYKDSLFLFSKNRGTSTFSRMYRLPDQPGNYTAELIDSFNTVNWITSADISPSGKTMVLFSEMRILIFTNFTGTHFFNGTVRELTMDYSQKEGIVFVNDSLVYITDEKQATTGGNLYKLNLASWINGIGENAGNVTKLILYPNPVHNILHLQLPEGFHPKEIEVYNINGKLCKRFFSKESINVSGLASGIYMLKVKDEVKNLRIEFVKE